MTTAIHTSPVFIVTALLNGKRWAHDMLTDDGSPERLEAAKGMARNYKTAGFKDVRLSRCTDQRTIDRAQFQIDKVEDWSSDADIDS